jgi:hypothetical protein
MTATPLVPRRLAEAALRAATELLLERLRQEVVPEYARLAAEDRNEEAFAALRDGYDQVVRELTAELRETLREFAAEGTA